jgi:uncharacterized MAPEG superfamily protein
MTPELYYLVYAAILGLLHLLAASHAVSRQYGYRWTASKRDQPMPPLTGVVSRIDQACTNFLETFPIFAAVVLVAHVANVHTPLTLWGARLYFWSRVIHGVASIAGLPWLRSGIWNVSLLGIGLLIAATLR